MIGFKTIEDYTFDECLRYVTEHDEKDPIWVEINNRYNKLLAQFQKEDNLAFSKCSTSLHYKNYLRKFKSLQGASKYHPLHETEAIERINQLKEIQEKERKNNKKFIVIGLLLGLVIGFLSLRFLPYIVASLLQGELGDSLDWGIFGFSISYGVLLLISLFLHIHTKKNFYNRIIAFFGGMVISCIPMFFYIVNNEVSYGKFSDYGICYGGNGEHRGIADSFGNTIIEPRYNCFYESQDYIIGIIYNDGYIQIDWYSNKDFSLTNSKSFWTGNSATSKSLKEAIESDDNVIINRWSGNRISIGNLHWVDPNLLYLPVTEEAEARQQQEAEARQRQHESTYNDAVAAYNSHNYTRAKELFQSISSDARAQTYLGLMYLYGNGVIQNYSEAVRWFRQAANQGNAMAQNNLGYMYRNGYGVPQDDSEAVRWYRLAANQGNAQAQSNLGFMYEKGRGVSQDYSEAVRWYRLAANQGNAKAQNNLGLMYEKGRGVSQDYSEAVRWFRQAANQGNAKAQNNLGYMYQNGYGVPQDDSEAVRWYRLAANQGNAKAQNNLGYMYQNGYGVPQDTYEGAYEAAAE